MKFSSLELKNNTKIIKKIGQGGFAIIYQGKLNGKIDVAVKVLNPQGAI